MAKELEFTLITEMVSSSDSPPSFMMNMILSWVIDDLDKEDTTQPDKE